MLFHIFKRFNVISAAGTLLAAAFVALVLLLAPQAALATVATVTNNNVTTSHWKQGSQEGYSVTATVTVPTAQGGWAVMNLSGAQISTPVALTPDSAGTTYTVTVPVAARPAVGEAYAVDITYFDNPDTPTPPETLNLTVGAVLDSFATPTSPNWGVGATTNPTFTWQAPAAPPAGGVAGYQLSISGLDETPWVSAQLGATTLSAQYTQSGTFPAGLAVGVTYPWSVYTLDAAGNSAENRDGLVMIGANISGTVTDFSGAPVADATVYVYTVGTNSQLVTSTTTRADGSYLVGGLNTTNYWLKYSKNGKTVYYNNRLDASDTYANTYAVLKSGVNAVLGGWGAISGNVVTSTGAGLVGYTVQILTSGGQATSYPAVTTTTAGAFTFPLLAPGTYKVRVIGANGYATLDYPYSLTVTDGSITQLPGNAVLYKINFTGTVTNSQGAPVSGVWVYLYTSGGVLTDFPGAVTGADGTYTAAGVAVGSYKVLFDAGSSYAKQYYNHKASLAAADTLTVGATVTTGINAVLGSGIPTVTAFTVPATSSSLTVSGITFTASEPTYGVAGYMITESATAPAASDSGWKATAPTSYTVSGVGDITLYAWAKGATGLVSDSVARSVTVTYVAPAVTISTLSDQAVTANQVLNVAGSAATGVTTLTVNGQTANLAADGSFSFPIKLAAGANTVEVVANGSTTFTRSITYDATAPALSVTQPADNQVTTTADTTVSGTVVAGATVSVSVNGGTPVQAIVSGTDWIANVTLAAGMNTIEVVADLSGKKNYGKRTLTLVSTLPDLVVTAPVQDVIIDKSTQVITGTVSSGATVSISAGGTTYTPQVTSGSFSQEVSFAARGSYPVTVTATSTAGTSTAVRNLIVERRIGDCNNSGGAISAADLQYAINITIKKAGFNYSTFCDVNLVSGVLTPDGKTSATDVQTLINVLIKKAGWTLP
ncbi:beta strand repeat-containing protein [Geomonas oryzae]|uniref:beta strand repeat-containing protein n=1 Tax=Geomonas oryzae TaxID=2364273 RepID=UPI00100A7909|nr:carboxypeptidase regulatory-like domain-containing protein [Geomonas oryzae]